MTNSYATIVYIPSDQLSFTNAEIDNVFVDHVCEGVKIDQYVYSTIQFIIDELIDTKRFALWDNDQCLKDSTPDADTDFDIAICFRIVVQLLEPFTVLKIGNSENSNNDEIDLIEAEVIDSIFVKYNFEESN